MSVAITAIEERERESVCFGMYISQFSNQTNNNFAKVAGLVANVRYI
jgi:hypothetical protein